MKIQALHEKFFSTNYLLLVLQYTKIFFCLIIFVGTIVIAISLLSLIYDVNIWWIKMLDFPREQVFIVCLVCLLLFVLVNKSWSFWPAFFSVGLLASVALQAYFLVPYTPLVSYQVTQADADSVDKEAIVSIMVANVYMKNRHAEALLEIAGATDPDMLLLMETDLWWENAVQALHQRYAYSVEYPLDNTYGMLLYSKYPLIDPETRFFQHNDVPSFHTKVKLPDGDIFYFHGMHPVPPTRSKYPDNIGEKEEALIDVGNMIVRQQRPAIVAGDFNDVAWSHTTRLFQAKGHLYDLRVGRGFYNSFSAQSPVMRWPLDHVYVTKEFKALSIERLSNFGSDHFPVYVKLALTTPAP